MNESYRKQVDNYLEDYSTESLEFYNSVWNPKTCGHDYKLVEVTDLSVKKLGLERVIIDTLMHNQKYASGVNGNIETRSGALRSALDVWRHIKKYNPEITIYEVMKCIADNHSNMDLYSHYCGTISRRVFTISDINEDGDFDDYPKEINDYEYEDEFGLDFYQWSEL